MYKVQILPKAEEDISTKSAPSQVRFFSASIAALLPHEEVSRICNIQKHARSPLTAGHASAGTGEYEEQNGTAKEQYGVDDRLSEDMQRADHRGHSEDKQDVEQVGADGIAQRQSAVSLFRGNDGGHQLRQGGASLHEKVRTFDQKYKSYE